MSVERAKEILNSYGGYASAWPEQERETLQQLLAQSTDLRDTQQQALELDSFMGFPTLIPQAATAYDINSPCAQQIMARLAAQEQAKTKEPFTWINQFIALFNKDSLESYRPVLVLASVVLIILGLATNYQSSHKKEIELLSLTDYISLYVDNPVTENNEPDEFEILAFMEPQLLEDDY